MDPTDTWAEVPAGTLLRGTPAADVADVVRRHGDLAVQPGLFLKEAPRLEVHVPAFAVSRVPVTQGEWNLFAAEAGLPMADGGADLPVDDVGWAGATAYCAWRSGVDGVTTTLPSEDQWERAARGDDAREYPWGDDWDPRAANTAELGVSGPLPVGTLLRGASPYGVLDLAGNADEWTRTVYAPYAGADPAVPPVETWASDEHVTRGGGWYQGRDLARCARRHGLYEGRRGAGFRLVREQ